MNNSPLFIVGMPRSGTKLLRDILNNNSKVDIPSHETHFIPSFLSKYPTDTDWNILFHKLKETAFFKKHNKKPTLHELERLSTANNIEGFIESVLKYFANPHNENWEADCIWGDKTPLYVRHVFLLKKHFPSAKILHIVRDPRDRALSVNKTWKNSLIRASSTWKEGINTAANFEKNYNSSYFIVKYEDLISNSKTVISNICRFIDIPYSDELLSLKKPSEKYGATGKATGVVSNNSKKYVSIRKRKLKKMEEIAYAEMLNLGYQPLYAKRAKSINKIKLFTLKLIDQVVFIISKKIKKY